jgi:cation-transporting P-type ATPase 13A2
VAGELFIDESSLTGESVPVPKFTLRDEREAEQSNHWVFEGSMVRTQKEGTLAMAVHIGFGSRRGRIIRKILTKRPKQPEFFRKLICFLLEVLLVSLLLFAGTFVQMLGVNI